MKIVRIIARLNVGGPARHVTWLTERLRSDEFESTLIAGRVPDGEEDMSYFAAEHGVEPIYIEQMSRELSASDVVSLLRILSELRRQRPDIVHTHTAKAGTLGRIAAFFYKWVTWGTLIGRPRRVKVVHTFHGHVFHSYYSSRKTALFRTIEKALARFATDRIIVISDQQFREINGDVRIGGAAQFRTIPLGIDLDAISATGPGTLRLEIGAAEDDILVVFVGRLTEIKDIPLLLDAFAKYADETGPGSPALRLVIIGDGHLRERLEERSESNKTTGIVSFIGNRENVAELINGADIIALTSLNEGTPLSLIEAMAAGKPVISTMVGGVVDLLGKPEETLGEFTVCERGIGVTSRDPADLLNGLIYLAKNERLRTSLGAAGERFVRENYSIDRLERDIVSLYRELLSADS